MNAYAAALRLLYWSVLTVAGAALIASALVRLIASSAAEDARLSEPIWIECGLPSELVEPANLVALMRGGRHVVLRFALLSDNDKTALIGRLSAALPECSVFNSGGDGNRSWITVMPVVSRSRVLERRGQVIQAIEQYRQVCTALVEQYQAGTLAPEWQADEHGEHCRFESWKTSQVVEAPLWVDPGRVDPYFFAIFVRSTAGLEAVAELLEHDFHDAARVLDVVEQDTEHGAEPDPAT
jgi:hypothetical protein